MRYSLFVLLATTVLTATGCINSSNSDDNGKGEYLHTRNPGLSAVDFLSDETYKELIVEIDYMGSYSPNRRALDSLEAFLKQRLNKTKVTIIDPTEIPTGGKNAYSANDIRNYEKTHRTHYTQFDVLAAYMIFLDGRFEQNNVLGIAYYNTSTAYFGVAYEDATSGFGAPSRYLTEAISFRHEFGHLLGLVGIPGSGTDMQNEHKDEEHGNHCDDNTCLMYYAMERPDLFDALLADEQIPALDPNCMLDLQANSGK